MKERIVKLERGKQNKKYTAHIKHKQTHKMRRLSFGDKNYQQFNYKDLQTMIKIFSPKKYLFEFPVNHH